MDNIQVKDNDLFFLQHLIANDLVNHFKYDIYRGVPENEIPKFNYRDALNNSKRIFTDKFMAQIWCSSYYKSIRERRFMYIEITEQIKSDITKYLETGELKSKYLYHTLKDFDY